MLPDAVVGEQGFVLIDQAGEFAHEVVDKVEQRALTVFVQGGDRLGVFDLADLVLRHAVRQVAVDTARAEVSRMHARTGDSLVHVKQSLTFAEAVNQDVHRTAIKTVRAQPQQVVEQTRDFCVHDTYVLSANRHIHAHHLFDGQAISVLVGHHRHIVKAVHVGQ